MTKAFTTIARSFRGGLGPRPARAYLIPLNAHNGDNPVDSETRTLQYFPATISDTHATNYQTKVIPGLSHPLYQWTSGGARTISFEAVFSRDRTYSSGEQDKISSGFSGASSLGRPSISLPTPPGSSRGTMNNKDPRNVDIPSAIAWLKSFLLPDYSADGNGTFDDTPSRPRPPSKLILGIPGLRLNWGVPSLPATEVYVIMKTCSVSYKGFFHDGSPRLARVALSFTEIIQIGGRIVVQDAGNKRLAGLSGYTLNDNGAKGLSFSGS